MTPLTIEYDKPSLEKNLDLQITDKEFTTLQAELDSSEYLVDWLNDFLADSLNQIRIDKANTNPN